ncbi:MAG: hypothetical protein GX862_06850, partial [Leucobacter sp.]|nr:hypothetical protein [Leucobacter sp.]
VDAAMSDPARARGVSKPVWVVLVVVLPVIGAVLWFVIGKGRGPAPAPSRAPDDDPRFSGRRMSESEIDAHVEELEARLRELDDEVFPGVDDAASGSGRAPSRPSESTASATPPVQAPDGDQAGGGDELGHEQASRDDSGRDDATQPDGDSAGEPR